MSPFPIVTRALGLLCLALPSAAQVFDGGFDSGNLLDATSIGLDRYRVRIRPDINATQRQWFYFSVADAAGRTLTMDLTPFDISSPWWSGMTPCVTSDPTDPDAWTRVPPAQVSYAPNALTFSWSFVNDDPVWFAYSFAYPSSRARDLVAEIAASPFAVRRVVGHSLLGRELELLEITEGGRSGKPGVWIQARQHPAESGASWTCEAFLRWLVGSSADARALRENSVVWVVPMVNPDGVALGNYRVNHAGLDLNRQWDSPSPSTSPEVAAMLNEIAALHAAQGLAVFLDLHTHSSELKNWVFGVSGTAAYNARERGYAQAIESAFQDFSYGLSSFTNAATGEVAKNRIHTLYPDALSYTQEQTYHTISYGPNAGQPITVARYREMGVALGRALVDFHGWRPSWDTYCIAKVNSLGCTPRLHAEGQPTLSGADDFHVVATEVLSHTFGLYFWGLAPDQLPLFGGSLCVHQPLVRTGVSGSGGVSGVLDCGGSLALHWSQSALQAAGLFPGAVVYGQFWSRDPLHPDGTGVNLTGGIWFAVAP